MEIIFLAYKNKMTYEELYDKYKDVNCVTADYLLWESMRISVNVMLKPINGIKFFKYALSFGQRRIEYLPKNFEDVINRVVANRIL